MEEYRSNSHKSKEVESEAVSERRLEPVISGSAITQKKSGFGKFAESMIAEDISSVGSFIFSDVLIPAFKKTIVEIVTNGIDMLLYGKTGVSKPSSSATRIQYNSIYAKPNNDTVRVSTNSGVFDFDNIIYPTRGDAEAVLDSMEEVLDRYGIVTVADLYDLSDLSAPNYTVGKYGWTNLRNAEVMRSMGGGYVIKLPKAGPIN